MTQVQLHRFILNAYPKPDGMTQEDYNDNIKNLVGETFKQFENNQKVQKEKDSSIDNLYKPKEPVTPEAIKRPKDDGSFFGMGPDSDKRNKEQADWDKEYGGILNPNTGLPLRKNNRNRSK